ncbi:MAG TPA: hypothetical protein PLF88_09115 [Opitutaceae bacterium]|nr:hypothetical protein [Opitutaceae bacterium]HRJ47761.1 hypothetical protein [Opitutaceae bacterium]
MTRLLLLLCLLPTLTTFGAINPAGFQRVASEQFKLHETSRIVHEAKTAEGRLRRVTIVAVVREVRNGPELYVGRTIVIDYTVNLTALDKAAKAHRARQGDMPGPQFMSEPEPPTLNERGEFWASLARAGTRLGNVNRHAGAVVGIGDYKFTGDVFVPVAGQYSFLYPM